MSHWHPPVSRYLSFLFHPVSVPTLLSRQDTDIRPAIAEELHPLTRTIRVFFLGFQKRTRRPPHPSLPPVSSPYSRPREKSKEIVLQTDMDPLPNHPVADLGWFQVGIGLTFIAFNSIISQALQLDIGTSLVFSALRCVVQLTLVATILQQVFAAENIWAVVGIALLLNLLGTIEIVVVKPGRRCEDMFGAVLIAMLTSTIPVSILGVHFAMRVFPFWTPAQYIPVVGMLCGNAIAGVLVSLSFILKELDENHDKTETLLAFGASRFEACRPLAIESLRLALMPTINQMSVMGIISIPGMMTGAILGGADVSQAARLQMIIMFMISASSVLACMIVTLFTLSACVDSEHRIRSDRIHKRPHALHRASSDAIRAVVGSARRAWILFTGFVKRLLLEGIVNDRIIDGEIDSRSERAPLLP